MRNRMIPDDDCVNPDSSGSTIDSAGRRSHASDIRESSSSAGLTVLEFARAIMKRSPMIACTTAGVLAVAAAVLLLVPNKYTSTATILPTGAPDKLEELKSLAGLANYQSNGDNPSDLFPSILRSRVVDDAVLQKKYTFANGDRTVTTTLPEYFGEDDRDKLNVELIDITSVALDKKTGVIALSVETEYPELSQQVARAYLDELENFNLHKRRTQARSNEDYLARQVEETKVDLGKAEQALQEFQDSNRNWAEASDPEVQMIVGRLQREVEIQNKKFLYLTQQHEMAKLDVQKDVPVVSILDAPTLPTMKSSPHRLTILVLVGIVITMIMSLMAAGLEITRNRADERTRVLIDGIEHRIRRTLRLRRPAEERVRESVPVED